LAHLKLFAIAVLIFLGACSTRPVIRPPQALSARPPIFRPQVTMQVTMPPNPALLVATGGQLGRAPVTTDDKVPVLAAPTTTTTTYDVDAKVIGAVLPLTGKNASTGQHALNALKMGLEVYKNDSKFRLAVFDSQSLPALAAEGARKLVVTDKAIVLFGGFTAKEAWALAASAEELKTPYIGFSQKTGLTELGSFVFRNAVTPEMQADKLVQFAFNKLSAKKFAILFPNDTYGIEFSNVFWDHVLARGGEVTAAQTYDPKETNFSSVVQKLTGTYHTEARAGEYKELLQEVKAKKAGLAKKPIKKNLRERVFEDVVLPPIVDFDVLFVPDNSRALGQIMAFMKYNEVPAITYLGTNIWSSTDLPKRATSPLARIYFVDALEASASSTDFFKNYLQLYNEEPSLVDMQIYEAVTIIKNLLISGISTRSELADNLRTLGRSPGVTGELRMSTQRELERPIHVLTLDSGYVKKTE